MTRPEATSWEQKLVELWAEYVRSQEAILTETSSGYDPETDRVLAP